MSELSNLERELTDQLKEVELKAKIFEARAMAARAVYDMKLYKMAAAQVTEGNLMKHLNR